MRDLEECSRCQSNKIMGPYNHSKSSGIWIDVGGMFSTTMVTMEAYICLSCGFVENYLGQKDLIDLKEYLRLKGMME